MSNHDTSFGFPDYGRGRCCESWVLAIVAVSLLVVSGCGSGQNALLPQASVEILRGKDNAGAIIEIEKRGDDLTAARVIDVVLGTGEAEISSGDDSNFKFTIRFPAGATITYIGLHDDHGAPDEVSLSGTWYLQPSGVFGADSGSWAAMSPTDALP